MMKVNNDNTDKIENWYFALWAYNSGYYPLANANGNDANGKPNNGAWGLGWLNNPINPRYVQGRSMFMELPADAAHPQDWPYQEKVIGWAAYSIAKSQGSSWEPGFQPAWWNGTPATPAEENRRRAIPGPELLCLASNECVVGTSNTPDPVEFPNEKPGPCKRTADLKCWFHVAIIWKNDCNAQCGFWTAKYPAGAAEPPDAVPGGPSDPFKPNCTTTGLPAGALIIDDVPVNVPARPGCTKSWTNSGALTFTFKEDPYNPGTYPARGDFHQLGNGFGAHQWFAYMRDTTSNGDAMEIVGTWELHQAINGWARLLVHVPQRRAHTQQAPYIIDLGNGKTKKRYLPQLTEQNKWVSLGVFNFAGTPKVKLGTLAETGAGDGTDAVSWDAIAFQPLPGKPKHIVAALGDSYSSGEGAGSYYRESDALHGTPDWNGCRRSKNAWSRKLHLYGLSGELGPLSDTWSTNAELGFVACSGAQTQNVRDWSFAQRQPNGEGQFKEQNQVNSGVLDENTTLVTLTLGGNDNQAFTSAMMDCAQGACSLDSGFLPKYKQLADAMIPDLEWTVRDIAQKAPNAQILLVGYPELIARDRECDSALISASEAAALNELANYADGKQAQMVTTLAGGSSPIKVAYANPVNTFIGHGACALDTEWINAVVNGPTGDGDFHEGDPATQFCILWESFCLSRESFHPKAAGTTAYATVVDSALNAIGYKGS
ncbi:SGNH/GDSL hydrolase family protein [Nonomuraea sp. NPDC052129]|uniref:SGNH/GDSL hydrolase family protein n=1 Tax=Nonomuraea sp. NPDC052129 TaxID=3154651 RepID=UPI0034294B3A